MNHKKNKHIEPNNIKGIHIREQQWGYISKWSYLMAQINNPTTSHSKEYKDGEKGKHIIIIKNIVCKPFTTHSLLILIKIIVSAQFMRYIHYLHKGKKQNTHKN